VTASAQRKQRPGRAPAAPAQPKAAAAPARPKQRPARAAGSLDRIRSLCLSLPEAFEVHTWDHPTFRVGSGRGKMFCLAAADGTSMSLKADPAERQALLFQGEPFYVPPYVGAKGWVGISTADPALDWQEVAELIATSYCLIAPKRLAATVTSPPALTG
jgi:predicted DNA-binding protein (MmcQ/YjbR family)